MIQRIQSLYLLFAIVVAVVLFVFLPAGWESNQILYQKLGVIVSSALSLTALFLYKKRKIQLLLGRWNILTNLYLLGLSFFYGLKLSGENFFSEKGIEVVGLVLVVIFLLLANKAIKKDENLVKSADSIR